MKKYRTLLYHSVWGDGHAIDKVIALATQFLHSWLFIDPILWDVVKLGLSHEEIWTPDYDGQGCFDMSADYYSGYIGTCYTSTLGQVRGDNNVGTGTCKRNASTVLKYPERWSYTEHEVSNDAYETMIEYLEDQVAQNKGYGLGLNKNVCSKLSHNANVTSGELAGPYKFVSPLGDALRLVKSGKEVIPLKG